MEQKWKITFYMSHCNASLSVARKKKTITNQRYTYWHTQPSAHVGPTNEYTFHSRLTATHAIDEGCNRRNIINSWFVINFAIKYSFTLCLTRAYLFIGCFSSKRHSMLMQTVRCTCRMRFLIRFGLFQLLFVGGRGHRLMVHFWIAERLHCYYAQLDRASSEQSRHCVLKGFSSSYTTKLRRVKYETLRMQTLSMELKETVRFSIT